MVVEMERKRKNVVLVRNLENEEERRRKKKKEEETLKL
jgi:hypothetical protein